MRRVVPSTAFMEATKQKISASQIVILCFLNMSLVAFMPDSSALCRITKKKVK